MSEERALYRTYDETNPASIERHALALVGKSLREVLPEDLVLQQNTGKGNLGRLVEKYYFGLDVGSSPLPDFQHAGIELKVTPVKRIRGGRLRAKERLVLQMIDFDGVRDEEWRASSFLQKNAWLLLVFYEWEPGVESVLDYRFRKVLLWQIPDGDLEVVQNDWQIVIDKIKARDEEHISGGDTTYLEACPKAAKGTSRRTLQDGRAVKPRAWAFKAGYMNTVIDPTYRLKLRSVVETKRATKPQTMEQAIAAKFSPYIGLTADAIASRLGLKVNKSAKSYYANLTKAVIRGILGVLPGEQVAEFEKAEIVMRTIRLKPNGTPKEAVSFPAFDYIDLVEQEWDDSDLRTVLDRRFFFAIYQLDEAGEATLRAVRFWTMPRNDLDVDARACFEETVRRVKAGQASKLPTTKENRVCHVRPHGKDSNDVLPLPTGGYEPKKSFWLNPRYLKRIIADLL